MDGEILGWLSLAAIVLMVGGSALKAWASSDSDKPLDPRE